MEGFAQFSWEYLGFIFKKDYEKEADLQIHVILTIINIYDTEFHWTIYVKLLPDHEPLFKGRMQKKSVRIQWTF